MTEPSATQSSNVASRGTLSREVKPVTPCLSRSQLSCARCSSIAGLAEALGFRVGIGDEDMAQHADRRAAGKLGLGLSRPAALCQRLLEGVDVGLRKRRGSEAHEVHAVFARPGGAGGIGGAVTEGRRR